MTFMKYVLLSAVIGGGAMASEGKPFLGLMDDKPAADWEKNGYPIGNGCMGAVLFGGTERAVMQFNVDSLWTGDENPSGSQAMNAQNTKDTFGAYQNFGELIFETPKGKQSNAQYSTPNNHAAGGHEGLKNATDHDPSTKWCFEHGGREVVYQVDFGQAREIESYSFTSANDVPKRDPAHWVLEGSNDGQSWKQIDKKRNQAPLAKRAEKKEFKLPRKANYQYYRMTFAPRRGVPMFQVAEITIGEPIPSASQTIADSQYRRQLDLSNALHTTSWQENGVNFKRQAFASFPAGLIAWRFSADRPGKITGSFKLKGAHPDSDKLSAKGNTIVLSGKLFNGIEYEAHAQVIATGGRVSVVGHEVVLEQCDQALVFLAADTNYVMDRSKGWKSGTPADRILPRLKAANEKGWANIAREHLQDYQALFDRVSIELGETDHALQQKTTAQRIENYRQNARDLPRPALDPDLEELLFQYGRYLLISSSRPGTLPANLQGIWCDTNKPAWHADYHSNINVQMNYWLAETANLPELAQPLFDLLNAGIPVYKEHTQKEYGKTPGFVTRMSINPFGGTGWNWNIEGTAWLAQHYWEHYLFSKNEKFLEEQAYPFMKGVSEFWLKRLKKAPNGKLVVPNVWSHEHGPYEDGTAHAQQLMYDLFTSTAKAAKILNKDRKLQKKLPETVAQLHGPQIGSWGQLMEWMEEKPELEKGHHRHTSHLFAVYPGSQISIEATPKLAEAARVSLEKRGEVGDSRRSWTWAWRTALWARMAQPERAHGCVAGLLAHNTLPNLWTTHPPFQIDGNLGITAGMAEMFVQSHSESIQLLPALPEVWPVGFVKGLRLRGGHIIDLAWSGGKLTEATITPASTGELSLSYGSQNKTVKVVESEPISVSF